ncbi:uncharacterized protein PFL1_05282 [Pseudozyma flocculosa PF-1]|uniref:Uncharacterized protein n=2 Tax=Pseudozyma flocculosa TaxID=84751 RepID=A0A5C3FES7_9BASI|nr:uncharacterized protein PFL1_05282 [Pseudozyma flocculosa PF-1]EPQ26997.1 hypothetical protein PFL1_05282 [Pseudozyma flocculosa PF-1]SPO41991.1 uncharacterized protein PSFLO_07474 [Pseudozyma flocculosa]
MVKTHSYTNRFTVNESRDKVVALLHDPQRFLRLPNDRVELENKGDVWIVTENIPALSMQSTTSVTLTPTADGLHVVRRTQGVQLTFTSVWTVCEHDEADSCELVEEVQVEASWMVMPIVKTRLAASQSEMEKNLRCAIAG